MKKTIGILLSATLVSVSAYAVNCKRTVSVISAKEMRVEITVNKEQVSGIARLAELVPEGAVVKYAKSEGGTFNIADNKIKFIWMALPSAENITVAYILSTEKLHTGDYSISGKFSFLEGSDTREFNLEPSNFNVSATNEVKLENTSPESETVASVKYETSTLATATSSSKIVYGIQVASTQKQLPDNYFSTNYNIKDIVKIETSNGQFKYILGEFTDINAASNFREVLSKKGLKDSFLVAFLNNQRISINEAKKLELANK